MVNLNLKSVWLTCKYEMAQFHKQGGGGVSVNTSSFLSHSPVAGSSVYAVSKGGADALTRAPAVKGGQHGVRVNTVNPGAIVTDMFRHTLDPEFGCGATPSAGVPIPDS